MTEALEIMTEHLKLHPENTAEDVSNVFDMFCGKVPAEEKELIISEALTAANHPLAAKKVTPKKEVSVNTGG